MKKPVTRRLAWAAVGTLALASALTACSSSDPTESTAGPAGVADGLSVIVIGGPLSDPFFGVVSQGGQDAADQLGATYEYSAPVDFSNIVADLVRLTETATSKGPDVLVIGDFIPDAQEESIKAAIAAGITVVVYNSGIDYWEELGAIGFIGENPTASGTGAGEAEAAAGVTNGVCVNHLPENPVLQLRCDGFVAALVAAGGTGDTLLIPSSEAVDLQAVTQKIAGYLNSHPDVDGVFTLGTGQAIAAQGAIDDSGRDITLGTTDISKQVLEEIKAGNILFTIDQQGYAQTYYATIAGLQDVLYGLHPVGPITTSPLIITADNVDKVLEANDKYGVRGAV